MRAFAINHATSKKPPLPFRKRGWMIFNQRLSIDLNVVVVIRVCKKEYDCISIASFMNLVDIEVQKEVALLNCVALSNCR